MQLVKSPGADDKENSENILRIITVNAWPFTFNKSKIPFFFILYKLFKYNGDEQGHVNSWYSDLKFKIKWTLFFKSYLCIICKINQVM